MNSSNDQDLSRDWPAGETRHGLIAESRRYGSRRGNRWRGVWRWSRFHLRRAGDLLCRMVHWRRYRLRFVSAAHCVKGSDCDVNADRCYADQHRGLFIVADGREIEGDRASQAVIETVVSHVGPLLDDRHVSPAGLSMAILAGMAQANRELIDLARVELELRGIEATAVVGIVRHGRLLLCSVGDSRAYLLRGKELQQLTVDDTLVQGLVSAGSLTAQEAAKHPMRHVLLHSVGTRKLEKAMRVDWYLLRAGDRLLLVTDGVSDAVGQDELASLLLQKAHPGAAATTLTDFAQRAGSRDDVTCIVVDMYV